jgi:hypothetical protein
MNDDQKCPRAGPWEMYGSAAIQRQILEKAQKQFAMIRPLDFSKKSLELGTEIR